MVRLRLLNQKGLSGFAGRGASIDTEADVRESILWDDVIVERGARVRRAILGDGVRR